MKVNTRYLCIGGIPGFFTAAFEQSDGFWYTFLIQFCPRPQFTFSLYFFQGLNFRLAFAIAAGAFGSAFQHGYNTGVVNAPQSLVMGWIRECSNNNSAEIQESDQELEPTCNMDLQKGTLIWSWIVASFCVGGIIGGSAVGVVASRLGR